MKKLVIVCITTLSLTACNGLFQKQGPCEPYENPDTMMLDGPGSMYIPDSLERSKMIEDGSMREAITARLNEVYTIVNQQWQPNYVADESEPTLETLFTTQEWQQTFEKVRAIERHKLEQSGTDEGLFFAEGGNVWTFGSFDAPFTPNVTDITFNDSNNDIAFLKFYLMPDESEGCTICWEMKYIQGQWLINDFILVEEDEGSFDQLKMMQQYIQENK